jgi:hypothetical protein
LASLAVEVDHVFVCTPRGAPQAQRLIDVGLLEGSRNHHPGQGTANRRFYFANAMLELLWVEDAAEAQSGAQPARRMHLWERWSGRDSGACPFGVCLRPTAEFAAAAQGSAPPFPFWDYRPPYSPVGMPVADNSTVEVEPLVFYMPVHRRMDLAPIEQRQPYQHPLPIRELTSTRIFAPGTQSPSAAMRAALRTGAFSFQHAAQPLLELGFDGEQQHKHADLRPALPLILLW